MKRIIALFATSFPLLHLLAGSANLNWGGLTAFESEEELTMPLPGSPVQTARSFNRLPLNFERNEGQAGAETKFQVRGRGYLLSLEQTEALMVLTQPQRHQELKAEVSLCDLRAFVVPEPTPRFLRMTLVGANPSASISGEDELPGKFHYFIGNDPSLWRTNISTFAKVRYHEVYPGIDLVYYGNEGQLEYDFVVAPGADPSRIELAIEGADTVEVDDQGNLRLQVAGRELHSRKPVLFQQVDGVRIPVAGEYVLLPRLDDSDSGAIRHVAFRVAPYDRTLALVIDPVLAYSTFLGGGWGEFPQDIVVDAAGCAYVVGETSYYGSIGNRFPTTTNAIKRMFSNADDNAAFVTKFNATGDQLLFSTVLCGSSRGATGAGIALDAAGQVVVTGRTSARDFPRKNALQPIYGGGLFDAFVAKLSPDGSALVFSTFLGGNDQEWNNGVKLDAASNIYVVGETMSRNFPTTNSLQAAHGGQWDWFITKMDANGTKLLYSTFLGGSENEILSGLAVDTGGNAYLAGRVYKQGEGDDGVRVVKLNLSGTSLDYSTSLTNVWVNGIDVDQAGALYLAGGTISETLPTTSTAFQRSLAGDGDAFVGKLNVAGSEWEYLTYLGGSSQDVLNAIAVDRNGNAFVAGWTRSTDFPVRDAIQDNSYASSELGITGFVSKLNPEGSALLWSTYLGGSSGDDIRYVGDKANTLTVDSQGGLYVAGETCSWDFPVLNAYQSQLDASDPVARPWDAFVTKIAEPVPVSALVQITRSGNAVTISWPLASANFALETSDSLAPVPNWAVESTAPVIVADQNVVTLEIGSGTKFFRLKKP